jgi:multiple sugar transport system substrate-binding protein
MAPRKRFMAAAAAALAMVLASCGSSDSGSEGGKTTLVWNMWSGSSAEVRAWNHLAGMVTDEYPNIKIEFQTSSFNDYWTKLAAQASSGEAGCILGVQSLRAASISSLLVPLDDQLAGAGVDLADFNDTIVEGLQVEGEQLAVPYDFGPLVTFYNASRFKQAGIEEPRVGWTVDDFMSAAQELTSDGKYGFAVYPIFDSVIPWALSMENAMPVSEDGQLDLTSDGFTAATQWYVDLVEKDQVAPPVAASNDPTPALSSFIAGDAAMVVDGPWQLVNVMDQAAFDVGVAPIPAGASGSRSQVAGSGFGISQTCEDPEEAMKAISVLTGPEALEYLAEQGRAYPARTAQQDAWFQDELVGAKEGLNAAIDSSVAVPSTANYTPVSQLFTQYGIQAVNGQMDVPTFLETVQQQSGG